MRQQDILDILVQARSKINCGNKKVYASSAGEVLDMVL